MSQYFVQFVVTGTSTLLLDEYDPLLLENARLILSNMFGKECCIEIDTIEQLACEKCEEEQQALRLDKLKIGGSSAKWVIFKKESAYLYDYEHNRKTRLSYNRWSFNELRSQGKYEIVFGQMFYAVLHSSKSENLKLRRVYHKGVVGFDKMKINITELEKAAGLFYL